MTTPGIRKLTEQEQDTLDVIIETLFIAQGLIRDASNIRGYTLRALSNAGFIIGKEEYRD